MNHVRRARRVFALGRARERREQEWACRIIAHHYRHELLLLEAFAPLIRDMEAAAREIGSRITRSCSSSVNYSNRGQSGGS